MRLGNRNTALVAGLGLLLGGLYFVAIDLQAPAFSLSQQQHVVSGEAGSPYRYRVLVPFLLEATTHAFAFFGQRQESAYLEASAVYDCLGLIVQMVALYALLREWFSPTQSVVGVAYTSGVTLATFAYFTYQPWSILEVAFFSLGFLLAWRGHWTLVGVVVVLASLNRETGVFLPLALLLGSLEPCKPFNVSRVRHVLARRETRLAFGLVVLSTSIFAALRLVRGSAPPVDELADVIARNLQRNNLLAAGMSVPLVFGLGWIFAALGAAHGPRFMARTARVVPFYLAAFAIWGWWREVRILTSLYPILVPLILGFCYLPRGASPDRALMPWRRSRWCQQTRTPGLRVRSTICRRSDRPPVLEVDAKHSGPTPLSSEPAPDLPP